MRRWKLLLALTLAALAAVAVGAPFLVPRTSRVTPENFERIDYGMSRPDVEAILGPPGDYRTAPTWVMNGEPERIFGPVLASAGETIETWEGDNATILVEFGPGGVEDKHHAETHPQAQGRVANVFWRIGQQWRRWLFDHR